MTPRSIEFQAVIAATEHPYAHEPAQLVWADQHLVALLLPADGGWFLEHGMGPCSAEALLFHTLDDACAWVRRCYEIHSSKITAHSASVRSVS